MPSSIVVVTARTRATGRWFSHLGRQMNSLESEACVHRYDISHALINCIHVPGGGVVEISYAVKTAVISEAGTSGVTLKPSRCNEIQLADKYGANCCFYRTLTRRVCENVG